MLRSLALAPALLAASALAGGGAPRLSPLGVPYEDTVTLHCRSGRNILFFAPNTQSVRLLYQGRVHVLMTVSTPTGTVNTEVAGPGQTEWNLPTQGNGLEWRSLATSGSAWSKSELYRVVQRADGKRDLTLLERCSG